MILALPWALFGLLALPAIWWLHRRLARPPRVDLPSLLFFVEEPGPVLATARRRRDLELALALLAAACLSVAAAGPAVSTGAHGRLVRVVVSGGAPAGQTGYHTRVESVLERIRAGLDAADRLEVVGWPSSERQPTTDGLRPAPSVLADEARAGDPGLAVVISDTVPTHLPADVQWVSVGHPEAANIGIVATDLEPAAGGWRLLVTVLNSSRAPADVGVSIGTDSTVLHLGPDDARAVVRSLPAEVDEVRIEAYRRERSSTGMSPEDALRADDSVWIHRQPRRWGIDLRLPPAHREAARAALAAVLGEAAVVVVSSDAAGIDAWVLPITDAWNKPLASGSRTLGPLGPALLLGVVPEGLPGVRAPAGTDHVEPRPLTADLSLAGVDLVYAEEPPAAPPRFRPIGRHEVVLRREAGGRSWPVLIRADRVVLVPDVTRGNPPLASTAFWPLLIENVVREFHGAEGVAGARRRGLLDPASTRLGRESRPFDPDWLLAAPADRGPEPRRLAPWFAGLAVAALLALWIVGARRAPARAAGAQRLATAG